ncbi:glutamate 5-kinase, partial [bacterium]
MHSKKSFSRIVVKVGSSLMCARDGRLNLRYLSAIARQINALLENKKEVVLVSSGAIACGMSLLNLKQRPREIAGLQAAAAIGQNELMGIYRKLFGGHKRICAQLLLTWEDFEERPRYLNVRKTVLTLLRRKAVPIINENDTVATDEIRFGDNDKLSSLMASLIGADLLIILSDVEGLYRLPGKEVIRRIEKITPEVSALCCNTDKQTCVGGMSSKIEAIKIASHSGIPAIIASGKSPDAIFKAASGQTVGTLFLPQGKNLEARKRWIA